MMISPGVFYFFKFFEIFIFGEVRGGVTGQKIPQNEKQLHPSCIIMIFGAFV